MVGATAPHTVAALAARHPEGGVPADVEQLRSFFAFRDFPHFLDVYKTVSDLVRTPDDVVMLVAGLADAALRHPSAALVGFGLGGPEAGVRRASFRAEFAAARAAGLHSLPHAGETVGPEEVWVAIDERVRSGSATGSVR